MEFSSNMEFSSFLTKERKHLRKVVDTIVVARALYNRISSKIKGESFQLCEYGDPIPDRRVSLWKIEKDEIIGIENSIYEFPRIFPDADGIYQPENVGVYLIIHVTWGKPVEQRMWNRGTIIGRLVFYLPTRQDKNWKGLYEARVNIECNKKRRQELIPELMRDLEIKYRERKRENIIDGYTEYLEIKGEYFVL